MKSQFAFCILPPNVCNLLYVSGICEPWDSATCQSRNGSLQCGDKIQNCNGINSPGIYVIYLHHQINNIVDNTDMLVFQTPLICCDHW